MNLNELLGITEIDHLKNKHILDYDVSSVDKNFIMFKVCEINDVITLGDINLFSIDLTNFELFYYGFGDNGIETELCISINNDVCLVLESLKECRYSPVSFKQTKKLVNKIKKELLK